MKKNSSLYIEQHIHKYFNQEGVNSEKMQLSENYSSIIDRLVSIKREVSFEKTWTKISHDTRGMHVSRCEDKIEC